MKHILSIIAAAVLALPAAAQTTAPFQYGDRAVYLGDSITDGGHYHSYIWLYYMTRFPYMDLAVLNAGIGGNTVKDMVNRLDGDVLSKKPTVLMVTFGMNDTGYFEYNQPGAEEYGEKRFQECKENFELLEKRLEGLDGVRIVMLGGSPYDETARFDNTPFKGKNAVMDRIVEMQKESAQKHGWDFVDFSKGVLEVSEKMQAKDSSFTISMGDRIHPDNDGHMVMAYLFLKAQGFAGRKVAEMDLNARTKGVLKAENCIVSNVNKTRGDLSFDYLAEALPYPLDTTARGFGAKRPQSAALAMVPFQKEMNQEILRVTGLSGDYDLYIDNELMGTWSADSLSKGINLAGITWTPQYQQAQQVMYLNEWRWEIERNFRDFAWMQYGFMMPKGLLDANDRKAVEAIDKGKSQDIWAGIHRDIYAKLMNKDVREARLAEMQMLTDRIYEINKPVTHRILLHKK